MAGMPWMWIVAAGWCWRRRRVRRLYIFPHVAGRIDRFLTGEGDTFQVDTAREAIIHGGWFGVGPGEGMVKRVIPDSHADFVFSVAGEEFGIVFCLLIMSSSPSSCMRGLIDRAQGA